MVSVGEGEDGVGEEPGGLGPGEAPRPLGHAGTTWLALGDEVKAREAWTAALQIDPQNADALAGFEKLRGSSAAPVQ